MNRIPPRPPDARDVRLVRASIVAFAAAVAGGSLIPGRPLGSGAVVVAVTVGMAGYVAGRDRFTGWSYLWGVLAIALATNLAVISAGWVLALDLAGAVALGSLALAEGGTPQAILRGGSSVFGALPRGVVEVSRALVALIPPRVGRWGPVGRGLGLGSLLVALFGGLFVSADRAFAHLAGELLVPDVDVSLLPYRAIVFAGVMGLAGAYIVVARSRVAAVGPEAAPPGDADLFAPSEPVRIPRAEWMSALGLVVLLFAGFVLVQVAVLFGGRDHVLQTVDLTYAQYARQGFFQLLIVAFLVLSLIAASARWSRRDDRRDELIHTALLGMLCLFTLVILASAMRRLELYEQEYGFTRLRITVHATIWWIAAIFAALMVLRATRRTIWVPRALVGLSVGAGMLFSGVGPERLIAERNVERYEATGRIDVYYLRTLSADAVPALMRLPREVRACIVPVIVAEIPERSEEDPWSFNLARVRARAALRTDPTVSIETCEP